MKSKIFAGLITAIFISYQSFAVKPAGKDPLEVTFLKNTGSDHKYQERLRKSDAWLKYLKTNINWYVEFNEFNQTPHMAYGKPVNANGTNAEEVSMNFIRDNLRAWVTNTEELVLQSSNFSGKYHNVIYKQVVNGLEVLNSRIYVKMTRDLKVTGWGADYYQNIPVSAPLLNTVQAVEKAKTGIVSAITSVSMPELKILPVPSERKTEYHLVYELLVSIKGQSGVPGNYYTLVDAKNGEILYRQNRVKYLVPSTSDVNVSATVYKVNPFVPPTTVPLVNLRANESGNIYYSDSLGNVFLSGTNPISAEFSLEGLWSQVVTDMGFTSPVVNALLPSGQSNITFDSVTSIRHTSGYYHVNIIHDFMKSYFPSFTDMDFPLPTRVDVTGGFCNAFWTGFDINFFETGSGCNCMSQIGDVVYHEYGHGINDMFYSSMSANFQNGAMHEGYSDVWAFSITQAPTIGIGNSISNPNDYIRRYDVNRKVYPQDLIGQSHADGEIIAGAWYDVALNTSWSTMTEIFTETFFDLITGFDGNEGVIYSNILIAALYADDNDGDLSNGTPNDVAIIEAFDLHGISLLNNAYFEHEEMFAAPSSQSITVTADLYASIPFLPNYLELHYRLGNTGSYTILPMTILSANTYFATIPSQPEGTVVSYFVKLIDSLSQNYSVQPAEVDTAAGNIPYFILVDCLRDKIEDFDANFTSGWMFGMPGDSATGGVWINAQPVPSFWSGDTCQPGVQHTPGGSKCAVTGNAPSQLSPNYNADVDNGRTTLQSPPLDVQSSIDPVISYWRWFTNDQGSNPRNDYWKTYASEDGVNFVMLEEAIVPDHRWRRYAFKVSEYFTGASSITLRFVANDVNPASIIEAAIDDIEIYSSVLNAGVEENGSGIELKVYPNPASENLTIDLNIKKSSKVKLEVIDNLGKILTETFYDLQPGNNRMQFSTNNLTNGVYYFVIKSDVINVSRTFSILR